MHLNEKQRHLIATRKELRILEALEEQLMREIAEDCEHPLTSPFTWENKNEYGSYSLVRGVQCDLCLARTYTNTWRKQFGGMR